MRYAAWISAAENERFASGSWDSQVGTATRLTVYGTQIGWATVASAEVAADGSGVSLAFDVELADGNGKAH